MVSFVDKQIKANKQNALASTGPVTAEGKAIISQNAVKHGIFARDLIISAGDGQESEQEYRELLDGLVVSFNPNGQMECLLVEKIAVDFWRLRRVLRFETGSIRKFLDMAISNYYNKTDWQDQKKHKTNGELDKEMKEQQEYLSWNNSYIKALKKGVVTFDKPTWTGEGLESDIVDNLYDVIRVEKYRILQGNEFKQFEEGELELEDLRTILKRAEYSDKDITDALILWLEEQNEDYKKQIYDTEQKKLKNRLAEEVAIKLNSLPAGDTYEKVIKYEKAVQRSILQNIALLKRLQSMR